MQLATTTTSVPAAAPSTAAMHGPKLPPVKLVEIPREHPEDRKVLPGWSTPDDRKWMSGGIVVSEQPAVAGSIGQALRWFGTFYGASTRTQIVLGDVIRTLGASLGEEQALQAARLLAGKPGAPSVALVRSGADFVLRAVLSPVIQSPYATGTNAEPGDHGSKWGALRIANQQDDTSGGWNDTGYVDAVKFTTSAVRAIVDGATIIRNTAR